MEISDLCVKDTNPFNRKYTVPVYEGCLTELFAMLEIICDYAVQYSSY